MLDLLVQVFQRRAEGNILHVRLFCDAILLLMSPEDVSRYWGIVSEALQTEKDISELSSAIQIASSHWKNCSELGRARAEHLMIESIVKATYNANGPFMPHGRLGIWASNIGEHFVLKSELIAVLMGKLRSGSSEQRAYVWTYFRDDLIAYVPDPPPLLRWSICQLLKDGDEDTFDALQIVQSNGCESRLDKSLSASSH